MDEQIMKKILLMFLIGTITMFSQTKTTVRGITLSYDKVKKVMTLYSPYKSMVTHDKDMDIKISINKSFELTMVINGVDYPATEEFFTHTGHVRTDGVWFFMTSHHGGCEEVKLNEIFQFKNVERGEEYILTVSDVCNDKYSSNIKRGSIIIN